MPSGKNIKRSTLEQWSHNFRNNRELPFVTNTAAISLEQLENYIAEAKRKHSSVNGFKIYFVRYAAPAHAAAKPAGGGLSQASLVIVPLKNYDPAIGSGDELAMESSDQLFALAFGNSQDNDPDDSTALCPPKCGL